jgi:hypothetical protein
LPKEDEDEEEHLTNKITVKIADHELHFETGRRGFATKLNSLMALLPTLIERLAPLPEALLTVRKTTISTLVNETDYLLLADASAGALTISLPLAAIGGRQLLLEKIDDSANAVTVVAIGVDTIQGDSTISLAAQYDKALLVSDGDHMWMRFV